MLLRHDSQSLIELLDDGVPYGVYISDEELRKCADKLNSVLDRLEIDVRVVKFSGGPAFSEYTLSSQDRRSLERITEESEKIREMMDVKSFRVLNARRIGFYPREMIVEISNEHLTEVKLKEFFEDFRFRASSMTIPLGCSVTRHSVTNLNNNLIVGGDDPREVNNFIDSAVMSLICSLTPQDIRIVPIDINDRCFSVYDGVPHIEKIKKTQEEASEAIDDLEQEIEERYRLFYDDQTRSILDHNRASRFSRGSMLPSILVIICNLETLADNSEIMKKLMRIIARGKNAGVNFLISSMYPVVYSDPKYKINELFDDRVAFKVDTEKKSRAILDLNEATRLLGEGDLIFSTPARTIKVQSPTISLSEIQKVTEYIRENKEELYAVRQRRFARPREESDEEV